MQMRTIMKNLGRILFTLAVMSIAGKSLAQEIVNKGDIIIHIQTSSAAIYSKTFIDIYKLADQARIIYAKQDSIQFTEARKDTAYINASKNLNYQDQKQVAALGKILQGYAVYDTTTVTINLRKDTAYNKVLHLMASTSKSELETSKIGKQFVLDGFGFGAIIITETGTKTIFARTPTSDTHPIIAKFLKETNERVRAKKRN